jgi:hypothetical protein
MTRISLEEVISSAKLKLRIDNSDSDNFLMLQIRFGLKTMGSLDSFIKYRAIIDIVDNEVCLPKNFYRLLAMRYLSQFDIDNSQNPIFTSAVYVDQNFLYEPGCQDGLPSGFFNYVGSFQIVGDKIVLNGKNSAKRVLLAYLGAYDDENGDPIITEEQELALSSYACYSYACSFDESYSREQRDRWYKEYVAQMNMCKGKAAARNFRTNKAEILSVANALVYSKNYFPL